MKTLLFANLIPLKTGAYETLLAAIGQEFRKHSDDYVVVFAGEPIPPVADSLRAVGVKWRVMPQWVGKEEEISREGAKARSEELSIPVCGGKTLPSFASSRLRVKPSSPECVRPWAFVFPALRIIREEQPDVVAVHFGNELPTLVASLLCRVLVWWTGVVDLVRGKKDILTRSREASEEDMNSSAYGEKKTISLAPSRLRVRNSLRAPRWVWEQDQQIQDPGRISRWISKIRLLGLGVDRYLAVYEGGRQSMLKRGIPTKKVSVIYNSIAPYTPKRPKGWLRAELRAKREEKSVSRDLPAVAAPTRSTSRSDVGGPQALQAGGAKERNEEIGFSACGGEDSSSSCLRGFARENLPLPLSGVQEVLLVTTGSLIPRKRIDFILRACAALEGESKEKNVSCEAARPAKDEDNSSFAPSRLRVRQIPPWRLLIIGEGPERERLVTLAAELGIADRVYFLGLRNDIREILAECDIYLHASLAETCTYAVTEAMAAGKPVIITDAGAAREQIISARTGYVLEQNDQSGFITRLKEVIAGQESRLMMGKAGRMQWEAHYSVDIAARQYGDMYRGLVASGNA